MCFSITDQVTCYTSVIGCIHCCFVHEMFGTKWASWTHLLLFIYEASLAERQLSQNYHPWCETLCQKKKNSSSAISGENRKAKKKKKQWRHQKNSPSRNDNKTSITDSSKVLLVSVLLSHYKNRFSSLSGITEKFQHLFLQFAEDWDASQTVFSGEESESLKKLTN